MTVQPGLEATVELVVGEADTAIAMRSGDVPVLATPRVVALAEEAAVAALRGELPEERTTVGSWVELEHLRPTRVGAKVEATARITEVDGPRLAFEVTVREDGMEVARARLRRAVVDRSRFA